jgi:hypothetical protein
MGAPWIKINPQTELVTFLILSFEWAEEFTSSWSNFREEFSDDKVKPAVGDKRGAEDHDSGPGKKRRTEADVEDDETPKPQGKGKKGGKDKVANTGGAGKNGGKDIEAGKKGGKDKAEKLNKQPLIIGDLDANQLWREGIKLRAKFQQASSAFAELHEKITTDPSWSWAQSTELARLLAAQKSLKNQMSEWHMEFLMNNNVPALKKAYAGAKCESELAAFLHLAKHIDVLSSVASSILRAHSELKKCRD